MAGGSGARFGSAKQFEVLGTERVVDHALRVAHQASSGVVVVVPAFDAHREAGVAGGATRQQSVANGLAAVPAEAEVICVHDAARPFASVALYRAVIEAVVNGADAAVPGVPVTDTVKLVVDGVVERTLNRDTLVAVQTPQAFRADVLRAAHAGADSGIAYTDDASMVEHRGGRVVVVAGEADNRKITHPDDLQWARARIEAR